MVRFAPNPKPYIHKPEIKPKKCPNTPHATGIVDKRMNNGHKRGVNLRQRDERGWMIPANHTQMYKVYQLMCTGQNAKSIASSLELKLSTVYQFVHRIKNPNKRNDMEYARRRKDKL